MWFVYKHGQLTIHRQHLTPHRLRLGRTRLTRSYLMSRVRVPCRDDCLVLLSVRHILIECLSLLDLRHRYLYWGRGRGNCVHCILKVLGPSRLAPGHAIFSCLGEVGFLRKLWCFYFVSFFYGQFFNAFFIQFLNWSFSTFCARRHMTAVGCDTLHIL